MISHPLTPRPHWRHLAVNIVSPAILTFTLFSGLIFAVIIPTMKRNIVERKKEMIRELTQAAWSEMAALHEQERQGALARAADEAASLAWMTPFPLLFLPGLLEEKLTEAWQRHQLQCAIQVRSRAMFRRSGLARQLAWAGAHLSSWWPSPTATPARRGECQPRDDRETLEFEAAAPMASTRRR